jgi:prevent-host-death family protein
MGDTQTINSSELGNQLGKLIDDALQGRSTVIQRHGRPVAVIVSISMHEEYLALKAAQEGNTQSSTKVVAE